VSETAWRIDEPIRTHRLELRVHRCSDLDDLLAFHSDPAVTRYIPWPVRTREQVQTALEAKLSQGVAAAVGDWIVLAIVLRESSTVIGEVLLKRGDEPGTLAELGYVIRADQQGKGLASEAVGGILDLARRLGVTSVVALVDARNDASAKLLSRFGFARDAALDHGEDGATIEGFRLAL
jgi:RimJ/RimL family protein N-acetyltransferase